MKTVVITNHAPAAIGPYSQAIKTNGFIFGSGQIPVDPASGAIASGIEASTKQVLENIKAILQCEGLSLDSVVKTTVFLQNMNDFQTVNAIYGEYFKESAPARSCVQVVKLPKDVLIEIEFIAIVKN